MIVCPIRNVGVPKKRAKSSAFLPNQSFPNADSRWACGRWNLRERSASAVSGPVLIGASRVIRGAIRAPCVCFTIPLSRRGERNQSRFIQHMPPRSALEAGATRAFAFAAARSPCEGVSEPLWSVDFTELLHDKVIVTICNRIIQRRPRSPKDFEDRRRTRQPG